MTDTDDNKPEEPVSAQEFTEEERKRLRLMMVAHEHAAWFWSTVGLWVRWVGYVGAAVVAAKLLFNELLRGFVK